MGIEGSTLFNHSKFVAEKNYTESKFNFSSLQVKDFKEIKQSVMDVHLTAIEQSLQLGSRSAGSRKSVGSVTSPATKLHVAAYLVHLSQDADAANYIVNSPLVRKKRIFWEFV